MHANKASSRHQLTRRMFLGTGGADAVTVAAGSALAQQPAPAQHVPRVKGPRVWLDVDQAELDAAYDQRVHAPNLQQIVGRYAPAWARRAAMPTALRPSRGSVST